MRDTWQGLSGGYNRQKRIGKRFFGRGDVKYAFLGLLAGGPMHGYQMMKALREQSGGLYSPGPGSIYPTLQTLEDRGWAESNDRDGRKVYRITELGLASLEEWRLDRMKQQAAVSSPKAAAPSKGKDELELKRAGKEMASLMMEMLRNQALQPEQVTALTLLYRRTCQEMAAIVEKGGEMG